MDKLIREILELVKTQKLSIQDGKRLLENARDIRGAGKTTGPDGAINPVLTSDYEPIAIVGIAGRFPGADDLGQFWQNLEQGRDHVTEIPAERWRQPHANATDSAAAPNNGYCPFGGFIDGVDQFDAGFFNISAREAELMDPHQRLFLEQAWHAFEDAGYAPASLDKQSCGVFVGNWAGDYLNKLKQHQVPPDAFTFMGNAASILAARIAYVMNLKGPALAIDTACSSSLVALHLACESIRRGECDLALAGGVTLMLTSDFHVLASEANMLSADGRCYAFDDRANGMVPGEGAGVILLKRLSDAVRDNDYIYATVEGSGMNQDGRTMGITAPSAPSQTALLERIYQRYSINPEQISYIETHGTGTPLGDPIEVQALSQAFRHHSDKKQYCAIGSVKTNIGHTLGAAGIAGILKTLLCMKHRRLVPSLHYETANKHLTFDDTPFYVNTETCDWESAAHEPRWAAVSSFGFSGTNAHIVLKECVNDVPFETVAPEVQNGLFLLSARTEERLAAYARSVLDFIDTNPAVSLRDMLFTLQVGREAMQERLAIPVTNLAELKTKLRAYVHEGQVDAAVLRGTVKKVTDRSAQLVSGRAGKMFLHILLEDNDLERLAQLWLDGINIDWQLMYGEQSPRRMPLPAYPFARKAFPCPQGDSTAVTSSAWVSPAIVASAAASETRSLPVAPAHDTEHPTTGGVDRVLQELLEISAGLLKCGVDEIDSDQPLIEMGADSIVMAQIVRSIEVQYGQTISIRQFFGELSTLSALAKHLSNRHESDACTPDNGRDFYSNDAAEAVKPVDRGAATITARSEVVAPVVSSPTPVLPVAAEPAAIDKAESRSKALLPGFQKKETQKSHLSTVQNEHLQRLIASHTQRTGASKQLTQAFRDVLADSRSSAGFRFTTKEMLYQIMGDRAAGSRTIDIDGNEYIDLTMGFGVNLFGHQPDFVVRAISQQLEKSIQLGAQTVLAGEVAELICELTGLDRVTYCNSGTEAVMTALRLARTKTGRQKVVQFGMSYHGHFDGTLGDSANGLENPQGIPMAPGIAPNMVKDSLILEYGNPESLDIIEQYLPELAAVLVEPVQSRRPDLQPREFLLRLRQMTQDAGVPLIFDEMITGFRIHPGGAQSWFGVQADLATYGKIVGGGMPIGVVAGKRELMDGIDGGSWQYGDQSFPEVEATFFAGTFCKHPLSLAAAKAVLEEIKAQGPALQQQLNASTQAMSEELNDFFSAAEVPIQIAYFGSLFRFEFRGNMDLLFYYLMERGVYIWEGRNCFLSTAHTAEDIRQVIQAIKSSVTAMQEGGFLGGVLLSDMTAADTASSGLQEIVATDNAVTSGTQEIVTSTLSNAGSVLPMTEAQKQLWRLHQLSENGSLAYHIRFGLRLQGELDKTCLQWAVQLCVQQHELLAGCVDTAQDAFVLANEHTFNWVEDDLCAVDIEQQSEALTHCLAVKGAEVLNPEQGQMLRVHLVRVAADQHILQLTVHHLIADGLSVGLLLQQIAEGYSSLCQDKTPVFQRSVQWHEYLEWQQQSDVVERFARQKAHWLTAGLESVPALDLPTDSPRPVVKSYRGARCRHEIPKALNAQLRKLSQKSGCTAFMGFLGIYIVLLRRLSGQQRFLVGIPASGRGMENSETLFGYCTHLLPIHSQLDQDMGFTEFMANLRSVLLEAYENQDYPFADLLNALRPQLNEQQPLVAVTFNLDNAAAMPGFAELGVELFEQSLQQVAFDLSFNLTAIDDQLYVDCDYNADIFSETTITHWLSCYEQLIKSVIAEPQKGLLSLNLLDEASCQTLLQWNDTTTPEQSGDTVTSLFQKQVEATPDNVAVVFETQQLTYQELNQQANQVAHRLIELGVSTNTLVGLCVERSLAMIIGLLGILKAGGAYVPLDPDYPQERLSFMLDDADAAYLLTQTTVKTQLAELMQDLSDQGRIIDLDQPAGFEDYSTDNPALCADPDDLAYMLYTSGSTGKPKGAMNAHRGIVSHLLWMQSQFSLNTEDTILQKTPFSFDVSVWELLWGISNGARLVFAKPEGHKDADYLIKLIADADVTTLHFVPSMLQAFLRSDVSSLQTTQLKRILCSGEALPAELQQQGLKQLPTAELYNLYGPTEAAIDVTYWQCQLTDSRTFVPIGKPVGNTRIHILDPEHQLQPIGSAGELCIAGLQVGTGYLNRPELTAEKFLEVEVFGQQERIYKTGDLARWLPDGNLEYLGRIDYQIKLHGFRIELGEIESVLTQQPEIQETVVILDESHGNQSLVAYVVLTTETFSIPELRHNLKSQLPDYMIPAHFVVLEAFALSPNGKVDRKALPKFVGSRDGVEADFVAAGNETEKQLTLIWQDILQIEKIGIHDNFFTLGGDSIQILQLCANATNSLGMAVSARHVYQHKTIAALADFLSSQAEHSVEQELIALEVAEGEAFELSAVQQWFFAQNFPAPNHWNQAVMLDIAEQVEESHLYESLKYIAARHGALRLNFTETEGVWQQAYQPLPGELPFLTIDLSQLDEGVWQEQLRATAAEIQGGLSLTDGSLWRAVFFITPKGNQLLWVIHHLVVDGVSWRILLNDLEYASVQQLAGKTLTPPVRTTAFKYWVNQIQSYSDHDHIQQSQNHWQNLAATPIAELPVDAAVAENRVSGQSALHGVWDEASTGNLLAVVQQHGLNVELLVLTAFISTIAEWQQSDQVYFDREGHGRLPADSLPEVSETVGWFTSIAPVLVDLSVAEVAERDIAQGDDQAIRRLKLIKTQLQEQFKHAGSFGLLRYLQTDDAARDALATIQAPQLAFNYLGQLDNLNREDKLFQLSDELVEGTQSEANQRAYLLDLDVCIADAVLKLSWNFNHNIHLSETIEGLQHQLFTELESLCTVLAEFSGRLQIISDFPLAYQALNPAALAKLSAQCGGEIEDIYPLSPTQEGMLFHSLSDEGAAYHEQMICTIHHEAGSDWLPAFKQAWQCVVRDNPVLRTKFAWQEVEQPLQIVQTAGSVPVDIKVMDLNKLSSAEQQDAWHQLLTNDREQAYDLTAMPLMRLYVCHLSPVSSYLLWSHPHILLDGWSAANVFEQLFRLYALLTDSLKGQQETMKSVTQPRPYRDYISWLEHKQSAEHDKKAFWQNYLAGFDYPVPLPFAGVDRTVAKAGKGGSSTQICVLSPDTQSALQRWAQQHQLTMNTVFQGLWALVLHHYSQWQDIVFGMVFSGRPVELHQVDKMVGLMINTLPVRVSVLPEQRVLDWLQQLQQTQPELIAFSTTAQAEVQRYLARESHAELFDSLLIFENYPIDQATNSVLASGLRVSDAEMIEHNHYPLSIEVAALADAALTLKMTYDQQRFDAAEIELLSGYLLELAEKLSSVKEETITDLTVLKPSDSVKPQHEKVAFLESAMALDEEF